MRVLDAGIAWSRMFGHQLHVTWTRRQHMPCRFDELFELPAAIPLLRQPRDPRIFRALRLRRACRGFARCIDMAEASRLVAGGFDFAALATLPSVMIRTFERFFPNAAPFADLVPTGDIRAKVARYEPDLGRMIGVHTRR